MPNKSIATENGTADSSASPRKRCRNAGDEGCYSHILVPIGLKPSERSAVLLGLRMAASMGTNVTLLHVAPCGESRVPTAEPAHSLHWLDAIDRLHAAMTPPLDAIAARDPGEALAGIRARVWDYLEREVPADAWRQSDVRVEPRQGDVVEEILRYSAEASPDLVILTSRLSHGWLPMVSAQLHRLLRQMRKEVIVVRPGIDASLGHAREDESTASRVDHRHSS